MKGAAILSAVALLPVGHFQMSGTVNAPLRQWARSASANVPLPRVRVVIRAEWNLDPMYDTKTKTIYIPRAGHGGWTLLAERGLFLHELGHAFDYNGMTPALRDRFKAAAGTSCYWWRMRCSTRGVILAPGEMFAETYMACALGLTRAQVDAAGYNSYGWEPLPGSDADLCAILRSAA